jgi:hypothetical protein
MLFRLLGIPKTMKQYVGIGLAVCLLVTLLDKVVLPLYPVLEAERAGVAKSLTRQWPDVVAVVNAYASTVEAGVVAIAVLITMAYVCATLTARRRQIAQNVRLAESATVLLVAMSEGNKAPIEMAANFFLSMRSAMATSPMQIFKGQAVHASLEIVLMGKTGRIGFLVWVPAIARESIANHLKGHYPDMQIEPIEDPLQGYTDSPLAAVEMDLIADSINPIRTDFGRDADPLNTLLSALEPRGTVEASGVQFIFRPSDTLWQSEGAETVSKMRAQIAAMGRLTDQSTKTRMEAIERKKDQMGYNVTVRVFGCGPDQGRVQHLVNAMGQFSGLNSFGVTVQGLDWDTITSRSFPLDAKKSILNVVEFAAVWHPPSVRTPSESVLWRGAKVISPPNCTLVSPEEYKAGQCRLVGSFSYPDGDVQVGWRRDPSHALGAFDALMHGYMLGPTGSGKSTAVLNWVMDDIESGAGVMVMEPHEDLINAILERIPKARWGDVVVLNASDYARPFGVNFMACPDSRDAAILASTMLGIFMKASANWGPRMERVMEQAIYAILATHPDATMYSLYKFLADPAERDRVLVKIKDNISRDFWDHFSDMKDTEQRKYIDPVQGRLEKFLRNPLVRNIVSQQTTVDFRYLMDNKKILLVSLSENSLGAANASMLGSLFVGSIWRAAASRSDIPEHDKRVPFFLWVDEFQNYVTNEIATILAEARKFGLGCFFCNQFAAQVASANPVVFDAIKANCGTIMSYGLDSPDDARLMLSLFASAKLSTYDIAGLPAFTMYCRLKSNHSTVGPFMVKAPKPRAVPEKDASRLILSDTDRVPVPPKDSIAPGVLTLMKMIPNMDNEARVAALAKLKDNEFAQYQQLRKALDWRERCRLLAGEGRNGNGNAIQMSVPQIIREASRRAVGTPVFEVEALILRAGQGATANAMKTASEIDGADPCPWL